MMNRFRAKKRGKDEDGAPRPSQESESSMPFLGFRKGKKMQEEEKKPIDLATVLPSEDAFRTSLLMTGLSARFSMLREQDDPNTKIGKASDDSVLFPGRLSRMDLAALRALGDIEEVESIKAPSPFARIESYHSDDADSSKSGSIMSRAKPTEGNNLFGGRQKIYKIPATGSSSKAADGYMSSRTLYDNDVSQSAFQKWRLAEKERQISREVADGPDTHDEQRDFSAELSLPRSESPSLSSYDQKRETSSTLSSDPSNARHSSAATSTTSSQPASSLKEWQPPNTSSFGSERSVTRTRRLYETGILNQDAQELGSSNLPRTETSNRQRFQQSPFVAADRLSGDRRLLAKASAPNLRTTSPTSASPTTVTNYGFQVSGAGENKLDFAGVSSLSSPASETDDNSLFSINPNDHGKATALGVFQKPTQPYDETRFAQRQLQLQRGRQAPTQETSDEPDQSATTSQFTCVSPTQSRLDDSPTVPVFAIAQSPVADRDQPTSIQTSSRKSETTGPSADSENSALRSSALPTPLSLVIKLPNQWSTAEVSSSLPGESEGPSPLDSPTLGPGTDGSGLNLMVRQHLRADSNASSVYDGMPSTTARESRFPAENTATRPLRYGMNSNPWDGEDQARDWNLDIDVNEPLPDAEPLPLSHSRPAEPKGTLPSADREGRDEFADRLADGARRVREKLTSYVETDSRPSSSHCVGEQKSITDSTPLPRPSGLGAILHSRTSKGSLVDRGRDPSATKALKMMTISPTGSRANSPGCDSPRRRVEVGNELGQERDKAVSHGIDEQHAGFYAFQQARGELQRIKGLEAQARHAPALPGPPPDVPSTQPRTARQPGALQTRTPSRDCKPALFHPQRIPGEEPRNGNPPANAHLPFTNDRQRSEQEPSSRTRYHNRVMRPGDGLMDRETNRNGSSGSFSRPTMGPPELQGTDKHSHIMPQQPQPKNPSRMKQLTLNVSGKAPAGRGYESGQPSILSPGMAPNIMQAPPTPTKSPSRPSNGQFQSYDNSNGPINSPPATMRRRANSRGVPEPQDVASQSWSNSRTVPSLPPINPRRHMDRNAVPMVPVIPPDRLGHGVERRGPMMNDDVHRSGAGMRRPSRPTADVADMSSPIHDAPVPRMLASQGRIPPGHTECPGGMI
ncbi:hypothetical protein GGS21DRAFT_51656 [Xylaria nigripes]|nr:hypothetical protein GGS21DRAFT_51656 [Xylaria nigripes]